MLPTAKLREAKIDGGSIGLGVRRSYATNAPSAPSPPTSGSQTDGSDHPTDGCWMRAYVGPARPSSESTAPGTSIGRLCSLRHSGTAFAISHRQTSTSGMFIAKTTRHDSASTSSPPSGGPKAIAALVPAVHDP